jgi:phosphonate transport system substrate-binding protein
MSALEPVAAALTVRLGRQVEILPLTSYGAMIDAQAQHRIDGGFYSASAFALSQAHCNCLEPLVAPAAADGSMAYFATILARPGSDVDDVADLEGKTVALGADDSVGARRMQLAGLLEQGVDPGRFGAVLEVESPQDAVRLLLSGAADAAFAWSSMTGEPEVGYSRGTLAELTAGGELDMREIAVIWRSAPIAHGPLAVLNSLEDEAKREMEAYFLTLEAADPAAYDALNPYYSGGYRAVEPDDYAGLAVLTAHNVDAVRLPPAPPAPAAPAELPEPAEGEAEAEAE